MKKWILIMLLVAVAAFGSVIGFNLFVQGKISDALSNLPEQEFPVTTQTLKQQSWQPQVNAIGFVEPLQGITISNQLAGVISSIDFKNGAEVKKGQVLVRLDAEVEKANLTSKRVQLPAARADYHRLNKLFRQKSISKQDLDNAEAKYLALEADIKSLQATIDRKVIKAPFSGLIGIRSVHLGEFLKAGSEIVRLEDIKTLKIRFTIPQTQLSKVKVGQALNVNVDAYPSQHFVGHISAIEPAVFYQSGLIQIQAEIPNPDEKLRSGMFAQVNVQLSKLENQIVIPQTAINYALYGSTVYVVNTVTEGGKSIKRASQVDVNIVERNGNLALVKGNLQPGDQIVVTGQIRLSNNSKVKTVNAKAITTPKAMPQL
ncbi:efflux RND transporter periplasmic adaptor subunit [Shewanella sp. 202IG2-18]|uniref:efflux RND transporter periplasmic adaptor subunit n=1 Tax=Parashewanella hymeniacidonis TaxID=2807618 RepID=UPI00195F4351|nr:efflux RND transporter periplasmic adaptor subunit [Parashewanella hymeniacidonis]MBM7071450.1 efflux RND transporter periplasmic adaptor subunit [Parashewanella hymeniacidonis]